MLFSAYAMSINDIPIPTGFLNDYSGTLTSEQIAQLNEQLTKVSTDSNVQIGVWLIDSTDGKPISDYALELGNNFRVGFKDRYDGIVILIAVKDREYFISTAKGTETMITDIEVRDIELKDFDPNFKKGDFYTGLSLAIEDLSLVKNNEDLGLRNTENLGDIDPFTLLVIFIVVIVIILVISMMIDSDSSGGFATGGIIGGSLGRGSSGGGSSGGSSGGGFGGFGGGGGFSGGGAGGRF